MRAFFKRRRRSAKGGTALPSTPQHPEQSPTPPLRPAPATAQILPQSPSSPPPSRSSQRGPARHHGATPGAVKKNYWKMAAEKLQAEDPPLKDMIAGVQQAAATTSGNDDFATQLLTATKRSRQELESRRWKLHMGTKEIALRKHLDQLVKVVTVVTVLKDVASAAASLDPIHAGLPLVGFCVLMQMATNGSDQYAAMVAGVDEVVTIVARYRHVEEIYRHRGATSLKAEFEEQLVSLYGHIIRYQIAASAYYRRNTLERFVRAIPKLDDLSEVTTAVRQQDNTCSKITQLFDSADAMERHQEVVYRLEQFRQLLSSTGGPTFKPTNVHWTVMRSTNSLFTGRGDTLDDLSALVHDAIHASAAGQQCRIVVTGIGGQGKSEICLQLAHRCRPLCWGVFWIDADSTSLAEEAFMDLARHLQIPAQTWEDACRGIGALQHTWLLVLDNADDPHIDYSRYFPASTHGVILLTSRNKECARYATTKHVTLDGLAAQAARQLLLRAVGATSNQRPDAGSPSPNQLDHDADVVAALLQSHPLALIQAGAYVARGHCTLAEYPQVYHQQRKRLLQFYPTQARSRYGDVYATFEASASILRAAGTEVCADALSLLPLLAVFERNRLPLAMFAAAWKGSRYILAHPDGDGDALDPRLWHARRLLPCLEVNAPAWSSFRLREAVAELRALSLVTTDTQSDDMSVSMHPLVHAWARDRQSESEQHTSWVAAGCVIVMCGGGDFLVRYARQFQAHLEAFASWEMSTMFASEPVAMISGILLQCGEMLNYMRADTPLSDMTRAWFHHLSWSSDKVEKTWVVAYQLSGHNALHCGETRRAVSLLEQVVDIQQQSLPRTHPALLNAQNVLAGAYHVDNQTKKAIPLLEMVVEIQRQHLPETDPDLLSSQHELAIVYEDNKQVTEAITLLEGMIAIQQQTMAETDRRILASQHILAIAYQDNGQVTEAVTLLERVVSIEARILAETHPDRLASQQVLATAYEDNGQVKEAVALLERVVAIRKRIQAETHAERLRSQHSLAICFWKTGRRQEALQIMEYVVDIRSRVLEDSHSDRQGSESWLQHFRTQLSDTPASNASP